MTIKSGIPLSNPRQTKLLWIISGSVRGKLTETNRDDTKVGNPSFYSPEIDALRTWADHDWNYSLKVSWKSEESSIGINMNLATDN